ncbi:hypothetical protein, partial [Xenorhabdus bovienii]|uniref:hypothetical protein n=1 Tax=Xenorhabdus bovienii TaxID=40576 RepID=UPI0023B32E61
RYVVIWLIFYDGTFTRKNSAALPSALEEPTKMTSTGALIVPKMLFHMLFQYQRHGINIKFPVTFFEMIAASKQHVALGYWRYPGKFSNNLLRYAADRFSLYYS